MLKFNIKKAAVITWDCNNSVYGITIKKDKEKIILLRSAYCSKQDIPFERKLKLIHTELKVPKEYIVILGGTIDSAVFFYHEFPAVPNKEVSNLLNFDLVNLLPYQTSEILHAFRVIEPVFTKDTKKRTAKILTVMKEEYYGLLEKIEKSKIKFDMIVHPFIVPDPLYRDYSIYMNTVEQDFILRKSENNDFPHMIPVCENDLKANGFNVKIKSHFIWEKASEQNIDKYIPAMLIGEYALSSNFPKDRKNVTLPVPKKLIPGRLKVLKRSVLFFFIVFFIYASVINVKRVLLFNNYNSKLMSVKNYLENEITRLKKVKKKEEGSIALINELVKSIPKTPSPIDIMKELLRIIPKDIWVSDFSFSSSNEVNLVLEAKNGDDEKVIEKLNRSRFFSNEQVKQRSGRDGSLVMYVTLKLNEDE